MIKRKTLIILLGLISVFACFACACNKAFDPAKDIPSGYHKVYLDYNGGKSSANEQLKGATLYVKDGKKLSWESLQNIENRNVIPTYYGYILDGFAGGEKAEDGTVTFDKGSDGEIEFWDFDNTAVTEDLTLYAVWSPALTINFILKGDTEVNRSYVLSESSPVINSVSPNPVSGRTIIDFEAYTDPECTPESKVELPYTHPAAEDESLDKVLTLYLDYIEGEYKIVKTANDFQTAMNNGNSVYLWNDVDLENKAINVAANYNNEINGRGFTVKNFKKVHTASGVGEINLGLFGILGEKANIHDITFENVTVEETVNGTPSQFHAGIFAGQVTEGAKFSGVSLKNVAVSYTFKSADYFTKYPDRVNIGNIYGNDGGITELPGLTLTDCSLTDNTNKVD